MSHYHGSVVCGIATKSACEKAKRERLGQCSEMTLAKQPTQCRLWATGLVGGRPMCDAHANAVIERNLILARKLARTTRLQKVIDEFMAWTATHPSVHDRMPR